MMYVSCGDRHADLEQTGVTFVEVSGAFNRTSLESPGEISVPPDVRFAGNAEISIEIHKTLFTRQGALLVKSCRFEALVG